MVISGLGSGNPPSSLDQGVSVAWEQGKSCRRGWRGAVGKRGPNAHSLVSRSRADSGSQTDEDEAGGRSRGREVGRRFYVMEPRPGPAPGWCPLPLRCPFFQVQRLSVPAVTQSGLSPSSASGPLTPQLCHLQSGAHSARELPGPEARSAPWTLAQPGAGLTVSAPKFLH